MEISDEKLQEAAKIIAKAEVEQWKNFESYPEPALSESFQQIMQDLIHDVEKGNIEQVNETVQMIIKGERIQFLWEHEAFYKWTNQITNG